MPARAAARLRVMKHFALLAAFISFAALAEGASAPPADKGAIDRSDPRVALSARIPGSKPEDLRATPVAGIYEFTHGAEITYISADAKYLFSGDMYRVADKGDFPNLTDVRRRELRLKLLADVPEAQMLVFGPANAAHTISVFTDVDCPWCRKLHSQIGEYNRLGIRVRYLFYPRTGPNTESWFKAESVWCSADRKDAFTRAKLGEKLTAPRCANSPVAREFRLGHDIGIDGTPGIVLDNGELIPGYIAPAQLLAHLQRPGDPISGARSNN
jgi:thiol:disulfide interchange protein DsbC